MSKKDFKMFVRSNPNLVSYVEDGSRTWQDFYEMYDIYGENSDIWNKYKQVKTTVKEATPKKGTSVADTSLKDLFNMLKKVDLDQVKKGAEGLQKAISLVQGFSKPTNTYQPRPLYQHLED